MILLIDNYDSFVYNLARYLAEMGCPTRVVRNDRITVDAVREDPPAAILLSPGPCTPQQAGVSIDLVREFGGAVPILGVCLGHQAIAAALDAAVVRAPEPVHGRTSLVYHDGRGLFEGLPNPFRAARYHSLVVDEHTLPAALRVTARTADGIVMAVEHRDQPLWGVQFHPESVLTEVGPQLLANFLRRAGIEPAGRPAGDFVEPPSADTWRTAAYISGQPLHW
jgi:anthranilate synthase/aminodeoxychorismate synthase-like glutamine amidotransferase